ncbi:MAG: hypothetical protein ACREID_00335 [Planctomycetota bacterium]
MDLIVPFFLVGVAAFMVAVLILFPVVRHYRDLRRQARHERAAQRRKTSAS